MIPMLAASLVRPWTSFAWGLQRGDPGSWLVLGLIVVAAVYLVVRRPRG